MTLYSASSNQIAKKVVGLVKALYADPNELDKGPGPAFWGENAHLLERELGVAEEIPGNYERLLAR